MFSGEVELLAAVLCESSISFSLRWIGPLSPLLVVIRVRLLFWSIFLSSTVFDLWSTRAVLVSCLLSTVFVKNFSLINLF